MLGIVFGIAMVSLVFRIPYETFRDHKNGEEVGWGAYLFSIWITVGFLALGVAWVIGQIKS